MQTSWLDAVSEQSSAQAIIHLIYAFLLPQERGQKTTLWSAELGYLHNMAHTLVWFLLLGVVVYAVSLSRRGRPGVSRFSYPHPIDEPREKFSVLGAFRYLLPPSFYKHRSFRCDMLFLPFSIMVGFFG